MNNKIFIQKVTKEEVVKSFKATERNYEIATGRNINRHRVHTDKKKDYNRQESKKVLWGNK